MTEIAELQRQVDDLRSEVETLRNMTRNHLHQQQKDITIIRRFLGLFNARPWVPFTKDFELWALDESDADK
ncbi:hypothetical protein [Primorskyibacter sp. S87]|uniref:hypothetical protein n=1 Tax=Primorskyibacter sp. S87 TaxID=3415126 RepID=UPI003C7ACDA4